MILKRYQSIKTWKDRLILVPYRNTSRHIRKIYGSGTVHGFRPSLGVLEHIPMDKGELPNRYNETLIYSPLFPRGNHYSKNTVRLRGLVQLVKQLPSARSLVQTLVSKKEKKDIVSFSYMF